MHECVDVHTRNQADQPATFLVIYCKVVVDDDDGAGPWLDKW